MPLSVPIRWKLRPRSSERFVLGNVTGILETDLPPLTPYGQLS